MSTRVHQLAKELNISSGELLAKLKALKVNVKSHMSLLNDEVAGLIKEDFAAKLKKTSVPSKAKAKEVSPVAVKGKKVPVSEDKETSSKPKELPAKDKKIVHIKTPISAKELSGKLLLKPSELLQMLIKEGIIVHINQILPEDALKKIGEKLDCEFERLPTEEEKVIQFHLAPHDLLKVKSRPPVVTLMGHVDHGKTSLLDAIHKTNITDREAGGITQHIGAYEISFHGKQITFLDTPGHEAFTAMRARGANATDIVILVVAADDGIMPQTIEAVDHARAAGVPIVVAMNKIDKPQANIDKVKRQLQELNLASEDWGGKTVVVPVSAKTKEGIDSLLEMILLEAELLELKANPSSPARGVVLESKISRGGPQCSLLVQNGTLKLGKFILAGEFYGKVKAMFNDKGKRVHAAGPSTPVEILGITGSPEAGEKFYVVENETVAREITQKRQFIIKEKGLGVARKTSLENLHERIIQGEEKELRLILKADFQGSLEAVKSVLSKIPSDQIKLTILHEGIGGIADSDVMLASASDAVVFGFQVDADERAKARAKTEGIEIRIYRIIYEIYDEIKKALEGMLEPNREEVFLGRAEVRQVFKVSKVGVIAGSFVLKGKIARNAACRVMRGKEVVHKGKVTSLKRLKDDVRDVEEGFECGIGVDNFTQIQPGDLIEVYHIEETARKL
ncbi:MAG: translation initiation factor IF-2 [Candidatus Omnitrophica bacterium]|nr:translation initiation factor IF-2 [Candidatus Omnitrophota bacterium]